MKFYQRKELFREEWLQLSLRGIPGYAQVFRHRSQILLNDRLLVLEVLRGKNWINQN
jgi:hypothetical protein